MFKLFGSFWYNNNMKKLCSKKDLWVYLAFSIASLLSLIAHFIATACGLNTGVNPLNYIIVFILIWLPLPVYLILKFDAPIWVNISYQIFIILSYTFSSVWGGYDFIPHFDFFVHALSGVIIAIYAYTIFINKNKTLKINPVWVFVLCFAIAVACGAIWEIAEFTQDAFGTNVQLHSAPDGTPFVGRKALENTMLDLIADTIGALIASIICTIIYAKQNKTPQQEN